MPARAYHQLCGVARALDLLGERWTLLVVRELMPGPRRFSDLLEALPGISTGLLTARLRSLQQAEVITRRRLPPPAASTVYELTDAGRELEPVILGLARWGVARLGAASGQAFRPRWALLAMEAVHDRAVAAGIDQTYAFEVGDERFYLRVRGGEVEGHDGGVDRPDVRVTGEPGDFACLVTDATAAKKAIADGRLSVEGEPAAVETCLRLLAPLVRRHALPRDA